MRFKQKISPQIDKQSLSLQRRAAVASIRYSWFQTIGYQPHRYQIMFHNSWYSDTYQRIVDENLSYQEALRLSLPARHRTSVAGRRGGKSESAGHEGSAYMVAGPYKVMIGCPSYDLGYKEFDVILRDLSHSDSYVKIVDLGDNVAGGNLSIKTDIGSECKVVSFDKPKKSGHGEEYDLIILSETGLMDNIGGETGVWNKTLLGTMASRMADTIAPTTPQGRDDWLFPRFIKGCPPDSEWRKMYDVSEREIPYDPDFFSLCWPSYANIYGFNEDIQQLKRDLPLRIFQEQFLGWFVKWSGAIWINDFCFNPDRHIVDSFDIPAWWNRIEIIDPGFSGLFAWIAAVVSPNGELFIVDEYSAQRTLYDKHIQDILERRKAFYGVDYDSTRFIPVYIDPEDPRIIAEFNAKGLTCIQADNNVLSGFQQGAFRFSQDTLHIFSKCKQVADSLRYHEWAKQSGDSAKRKEANDKWKHFSDDVRYLCNSPIWSSEEPKPIQEMKGVRAWDIMNSSRGNLYADDGDWRSLHA